MNASRRGSSYGLLYGSSQPLYSRLQKGIISCFIELFCLKCRPYIIELRECAKIELNLLKLSLKKSLVGLFL